MRSDACLNAKSFDHVTLICADLEATRGFYVDFIGMKEVRRPAFKFPGLWFELAGVLIHATGQSRESGPAGWAKGGTVTSRSHHIAFAVDDVNDALPIVEQRQIPIASPLQVRPDGFKQLYLNDPDGHLVELVSE